MVRLLHINLSNIVVVVSTGALAVEFINVGDKNLLIVAESASEIANIYVIEEVSNGNRKGSEY